MNKFNKEVTMQNNPVVIVSAQRTPIGNFQGYFKHLTASELGSVAIQAVMEKTGLPNNAVQEVIIGCVLAAGQGQAPARQAAIKAGLSVNTACTTINKMCGSGMKAVMLAHDSLLANGEQIVIAGGMESMSNAPYLLPNARTGYRMGHQTVLDHMFYDGLEDAYDKGKLMGVFAENCAEKYNFSRAAQDDFTLRSVKRAQSAQQNNDFAAEIAAITLANGDTIEQDEGPQTTKIEKIPQLRPAFRQNGTITAANASSISDGAAVLLLMRRAKAEQLGLKPLATIVSHSSHAQDPSWFTTAPISAIRTLLQRIHWHIDDVDLFEINEAFAVVTMAAIHELKVAEDKVNIHGGACVLGHPIGASGARIIVTLLHAMQRQNVKRGIAALCIGGGEATAIAMEIDYF
jgi:acetyl-CoA C-acetyltransferase